MRLTRKQVTFSPLFIGEGSGTPPKQCQDHNASHLSVPSSSGKALELTTEQQYNPLRLPFSPLFIGEGSGTARYLSLYQRIIPKQIGNCTKRFGLRENRRGLRKTKLRIHDPDRHHQKTSPQ